MGRLVELLIAHTGEDGAEYGMVRFRTELAEVADHPPRFAADRNGLIDTAPRTVTATGTMSVARPEFDAWAASGPFGLPPVGIATLDGSPFLPQLQSAVAPIRQWGAFDWVAGRVVVEAPPEIASLPWERALPLDRTRVALLRRRRGAAPELPYGRLLTPELRFCAGGLLRDDLLPPDLVQQLSDRRPGVRWVGEPSDADLWHLSAPAPADAEGAIDALGPGGGAAPRVLVVHLPIGPVPLVQRLVDAAWRAGLWAVVVAPVPPPSTAPFFQTFYRKLLHNWPLEFCLSLASTMAFVEGAQVHVRPGGETALALTRIPAEIVVSSTRAIRGEVSSTPDPVPPFDPWESPDFGGGGLEGVDGAPSPARPSTARDRRVSADLTADLTAVSESAVLDRTAGDLAEAAQLGFDEEMHDLDQLDAAALTVDATVQEVQAASAELAATVAEAVPGPRFLAVTVAGRGSQDPVPDRVALRLGRAYDLRVAITPHVAGAQVARAFDESSLAAAFRAHTEVALEVVVFAPDSDFAVPENTGSILLPRVGASTTAVIAVTPLRAGRHSLRVAVYRESTLLQSALVEIDSADGHSDEVRDEPVVRTAPDWAASGDLQLLDELDAPAFSIFCNAVPDGSHWIGVFSSDGDPPSMPLRSGRMRDFRPERLQTAVSVLRDAIQAVHGTDTYLYPSAPVGDPAVAAFGRDAIVDLARHGWQLYDSLFRSVPVKEFSEERRIAFEAALADPKPGVVSVAVCKSSWTLPWAAVYDKPIDGGSPRLQLCEVFADQLGNNVWDEQGALVGAPKDLIDDPAACRALPSCPLNTPRRRKVTVCPFGFWGMRHQIEQPLQMISATADGEVPAELGSEGFLQTSAILHRPGDAVRAGGGAFPFQRFQDHMDALAGIAGIDFKFWEDRDDVLDNLFLSENGLQLVYFYCHGRKVDGVYSLQVGPLGEDTGTTIVAANIDNDDVLWGRDGTPQPLVLLMACESSAARIEVANDLFDKLNRINAAGVVGAEIDIGVRLGRETGLDLMTRVAGGVSVGEALLQMRRDLLRRWNPLGLVLTANAPAALHLCAAPGTGTSQCARYHRRHG